MIFDYSSVFSLLHSNLHACLHTLKHMLLYFSYAVLVADKSYHDIIVIYLILFSCMFDFTKIILLLQGLLNL